MGKTKEIRKYLDSITAKRILFISFRITFSNALKQKFPEFALYTDSAVCGTNIIAEDKLIIQVDSLHKLSAIPYDLLILDEAESIFDQLRSPLIKHTPDVILMDANLQMETIENMKRFRGQVQIHQNIYKNNKHLSATVCMKSNFCEFMNKIYSTLQYHDSTQSKFTYKNIYVATNSKKMAKQIYSLIEKQYFGIKIIMYSSETDEQLKQDHFRNVNTTWTQYQRSRPELASNNRIFIKCSGTLLINQLIPIHACSSYSESAI